MTERAPEPNFFQAGQFLHSILRNFEQVFPDDLQKMILIKKGMACIKRRVGVDRGEIVGGGEQYHQRTYVFEKFGIGTKIAMPDHPEQRLLLA